MDQIDKVVDEIRKMKQEVENGARQIDVARKYKISAIMLSDIQHTVDINNLKRDIEFIEKSLNSGENLKRTSRELPYGPGLFNYIVRKIRNKDKKRITVDNKKVYAEKLENMWRLYKAGEKVSVIACKYNSSIEETQYIVEKFEDKVNMARKSYAKQGDFNEEIERKKTRKKYLSDDIVDYILHGKPIDFSKKGNIGEDGRDEL